MDANSGERWSEMDIADLTHSPMAARSQTRRVCCAGTRMKSVRRRKSFGWSSARGASSSRPIPTTRTAAR